MRATGTWWDRLYAFLLICLVQEVHRFGASFLPRDQDIGFVYFGTALLADFLIIAIAAHCLKGQLSRNIQWLNWIAMAAQAFGYFNYEFEIVAPAIYNQIIKVLVAVQFLRFLWVDRHDADYIGPSVVRGRVAGRPELHN